jgi:hypothetical protein
MNGLKTVMVVLNNSDELRSVDVSRFEECLNGVKQGKDVVTGKDVQLEGLSVEGKSALVLDVSAGNR